LGKDRIILGLPWFQELEPTILWKQGELLGDLTVKTSSKILEINKMTLTTSWAIQGEADKTRMSEKDVPEQYKDYSDIFSEEKAKRFPPAREEDHQIKFTKNVPKYFKGDVYLLTTDHNHLPQKMAGRRIDKGIHSTVKIAIPLPIIPHRKEKR
jgi:hypothetical protein